MGRSGQTYHIYLGKRSNPFGPLMGYSRVDGCPIQVEVSIRRQGSMMGDHAQGLRWRHGYGLFLFPKFVAIFLHRSGFWNEQCNNTTSTIFASLEPVQGAGSVKDFPGTFPLSRRHVPNHQQKKIRI